MPVLFVNSIPSPTNPRSHVQEPLVSSQPQPAADVGKEPAAGAAPAPLPDPTAPGAGGPVPDASAVRGERDGGGPAVREALKPLKRIAILGNNYTGHAADVNDALAAFALEPEAIITGDGKRYGGRHTGIELAAAAWAERQKRELLLVPNTDTDKGYSKAENVERNKAVEKVSEALLIILHGESLVSPEVVDATLRFFHAGKPIFYYRTPLYHGQRKGKRKGGEQRQLGIG